MTKETDRILTVIVPAYNMGWCLEKNLNTYLDKSVCDRISVIVLDNSSSDGTLAIAKGFEREYPDIFTVVTKENRGYGSSVNLGIKMTKTKYFRVVDADDCICPSALSRLLDVLSDSDADVIQTPYSLFDIQSGKTAEVQLSGCDFGTVKDISAVSTQSPFPSIHTTTLKTALAKENSISLLENAYYVDEELSLYPFFYAKSIIALDGCVYRYSVNNASQSVSIENKVKNREHRDRIIKRMMDLYKDQVFENGNGEFCFWRVARSVGDHFTTLYVLNPDKKEGRKEARLLSLYIKERHPEFYLVTRKKRILLSLLNRFSVSVRTYERIKKFLGYKEYSSIC